MGYDSSKITGDVRKLSVTQNLDKTHLFKQVRNPRKGQSNQSFLQK